MKKVSTASLVASFFVLALCLVLPLSAYSASPKLIVTDSGGSNTVFSVDDTGQEYATKIGVGTAAPLTSLQVTELDGSSSTRGIISSQNYDGNTAAVYQYMRSRGTDVAPTALINGDAIGAFHFLGYDGTTYQYVSSIISKVNGAVGAGSVPGELRFHTGINSSDSLAAPRMIITSTGKIGIGTTSPTQMFDVNSNGIRIRTAKTPTSSSAACNQGEMSWDVNYVYVCVASNTWKRAALAGGW